VRGITYDPVAVKKEALKVDAAPLTTTKRELPDDDTPMIEAEELEAGEVVLKEEDEDDDAMLNAIENVILVTEAEEKAAAESEDLNVGASSEQTFSTGMASTLNILRQQGLLASTSRAPSAAPQPQTFTLPFSLPCGPPQLNCSTDNDIMAPPPPSRTALCRDLEAISRRSSRCQSAPSRRPQEKR
jgi:hypothetical protein